MSWSDDDVVSSARQRRRWNSHRTNTLHGRSRPRPPTASRPVSPLASPIQSTARPRSPTATSSIRSGKDLPRRILNGGRDPPAGCRIQRAGRLRRRPHGGQPRQPRYVGRWWCFSASRCLCGGLQGALSPVAADADFAAEKAQQAGTGAVVGAYCPRRLRGINATPEAKSLMDQGVTLTPGQAAGAGSMLKRAEEYASSLPVAGHFIRNAQNRAVEEANVAAAQQVARMVNETIKLGKPPREAIEQDPRRNQRRLPASLEGMSWPADALANDLRASMKHLPTDLPLVPAKTMKEIETYLINRLGPWVEKGGDLTGAQLKQVDAELGQRAPRLGQFAEHDREGAGPRMARSAIVCPGRDGTCRRHPGTERLAQ